MVGGNRHLSRNTTNIVIAIMINIPVFLLSEYIILKESDEPESRDRCEEFLYSFLKKYI